ncbi:MAG: hypothetical protein US58_C0007G0021 [Candidatus Magasanikbacteria bacterium GW2011_GWA2_37_8]|uniref:Uncharacterized protein n=1 Tax=Candidatus Magasanikbacteria bacterium GW2011_GWA2_37_8 TaxID=1619036 RepID=A0A0G0HQW2_9BACT|nr:MAG: hypothetical protein US58_C0007G0021 [Candidatus Magasanikbacteria bacterium GW2011_GWA2_37_8]
MSKNWAHVKLIKILLVFFLIAFITLAIAFFYSTKPYRINNVQFQSSIGESLKIFIYNESTFSDPVSGCWYDSGDYVVFLHRNVQSFYYLSLAYNYAKTPTVKSDIKLVLDRQKNCIDIMLSKNYKQFGDQKSHGINIPPLFNSIFYSRNNYQFKQNEGKDVYLLYGLSLNNLGYAEKAKEWLQQSERRTDKTISENCCEEGVLTITPKNMISIEKIYENDLVQTKPNWGFSFSNISFLKSKKYNEIKSYLTDVSKLWKENSSIFNYIGGNYDIAGTIAFERLYARDTGDNSFKELSNSMMNYLQGENSYNINFLNYPNKYHPCDFFGNCKLEDTLINGVDETGKFETNRKDVWRLTEVQLIGQAQYVLAEILYNNL